MLSNMDSKLPLRLSFRNLDTSLVPQVERALHDADFEILNSSTYGIDTRASRRAIEDFFHTAVTTEGRPAFMKEPLFQNLPQGPDYRAYFPTKPQLF